MNNKQYSSIINYEINEKNDEIVMKRFSARAITGRNV